MLYLAHAQKSLATYLVVLILATAELSAQDGAVEEHNSAVRCSDRSAKEMNHTAGLHTQGGLYDLAVLLSDAFYLFQ